ncbi:hypothetical protein EJF36_19610 [Bacillus sp. HMF5848]|nr:hypothetical protein EJF36_19610 [Bacillus sp. HMF5848]
MRCRLSAVICRLSAVACRLSAAWGVTIGFWFLPAPGFRFSSGRMSLFYHSRVDYLPLLCRLSTTPVSNFYHSHVDYLPLPCRCSPSCHIPDVKSLFYGCN